MYNIFKILLNLFIYLLLIAIQYITKSAEVVYALFSGIAFFPLLGRAFLVLLLPKLAFNPSSCDVS